ncbi:MAG TPA: carbonic anhydrase family protein [Polyangia bacterium]|jgi:carbonic anhydrase|nr:carbonic anhydrase family protein [Polyangia bacterium]
MTRLLCVCAVFVLGCSANSSLECAPSPTPYWDYSGTGTGPTEWGSLPGYELCANGTRQSPIDIVPPQAVFDGSAEHPLLDLDLTRVARFINTGRSLVLEFERGEGLVYGGARYDLANVHFHSPAEHSIDGKVYAMEAHIVTLERDSQQPSALVLGVFLDTAKAAANPLLAAVLDGFPQGKARQNCTLTPDVPVDLELARVALPDTAAQWTYQGSLTTPTCGEYVRFFLYRDPVAVSQAQVDQFKRVVGQSRTSRPVQPLNGRTITLVP